jgi:UDP-glucuronate 4-epimerase
MMRRMSYLVTGALGALGAWTVRSLLDRGEAVVTYDLGGSDHRLRLALSEDELAALPRVDGDVTDLAHLERVMDEHDVTGVIHLAALQVPFVRADPMAGARVNVSGTVNVLEAVRRRKDRIGHVVYASSIAVYGAGGTLDAADVPGTLYGVTKRANEGAALRYSEDYGVSSIGLRPHTVYGPARDQGMTSAPTVAMLATAAGVPFRIPFGGSVQLQYAPDVGEAFARTAELEYDGASVHNVDGPVVAISDLVGLLGEGITADDQALPFPGGVDGSSFVALLGGSVMRSVQDGVIDAVQRFERLLAAGLVKPP